VNDWDRRASVRSRPRRLVSRELPGTLFFSPSLVPTLAHPLVDGLGEEETRALLVHHLYTYLDFTAELEHRIVNWVTLRLAQNELGIRLSGDMRFDAHKLYCDEAYHALMSADVKRQVEEATGIRPLEGMRPSLLDELETALQGLDDDERRAALLLFVIVSETLISETLRKIPRDQRVIPAVRESISDHAHDESYHHAYFSAVLRLVWPQLTDELKDLVGALVPRFIKLFLQPDRPAIKRSLEACGVPADRLDDVLTAAYPPDRFTRDARETGRATIRLFAGAGAFETKPVADAFRTAGLVGRGHHENGMSSHR
jgi:P-aminobenzoate N-oxygenase AurF